MPFIFKHIAVMPDVHVGKGSTVGSVIPDAEGGDSCGGGRGHRLRHDRREDDADAADLPDNLGARARGHRTGRAARAYARQARQGRVG